MKIPDLDSSKYRFNVKLASSTRFGTGGEAEVLFQPNNIEELQYFLQNCDQGVPITVIGACSNVLIRDGGIAGVVIKLGTSFAEVKVLNNLDPNSNLKIQAGARAFDTAVVKVAMDNSIGGLEFLIGIPGTIGGNIRMNAGCYNMEMKDIIDVIHAIDRKGDLHEFKASDIEFHYRGSNLPKDLIFTHAILKGKRCESSEILEKIMQIKNDREKTQPYKAKTAGSTFRNPEGQKAWKIIEKCGLKGIRVGDAEFSSKHCNFLINTGNATSGELEALAEMARAAALSSFNVNLEWEVLRIGSFAPFKKCIDL